jgi:hypothetical protein
MKILVATLVFFATCLHAQIKDTSFTVKGLFKVRLTNQDADQVIRNDYVLVEVQNISGKDIYFFNQVGDSRAGLNDNIKNNNIKYIIFGEPQPDVKLENVELQKVAANDKIVKTYMSSTDEKGITLNYINDGAYVNNDKKKPLIKRSDYMLNLKSQSVLIPQ